MRKYIFANPLFRDVDLTKYEDLIIEKIHEVVPDAKVIVEKNGYILEENVSRGDVIKIGRNIAASDLWAYRLPRDLLFVGKKITEQK